MSVVTIKIGKDMVLRLDNIIKISMHDSDAMALLLGGVDYTKRMFLATDDQTRLLTNSPSSIIIVDHGNCT